MSLLLILVSLVWWGCLFSVVPITIAYLFGYITLRNVGIYILTFVGLSCLAVLCQYSFDATET
ncbi:MAG TPA: hypothetical protein VJB56_00290 [Candidatus Paceibacterota bacterium]